MQKQNFCSCDFEGFHRLGIFKFNYFLRIFPFAPFSEPFLVQWLSRN